MYILSDNSATYETKILAFHRIHWICFFYLKAATFFKYTIIVKNKKNSRLATNWTGHWLQKDIRTTQVKQRRQGHQSIELEMRRHPILYNWRVSRGQLCQQSQLQSGCQLSTVNAKCASGSFWSLFFNCLNCCMYVVAPALTCPLLPENQRVQIPIKCLKIK